MEITEIVIFVLYTLPYISHLTMIDIIKEKRERGTSSWGRKSSINFKYTRPNYSNDERMTYSEEQYPTTRNLHREIIFSSTNAHKIHVHT